MRCSIVAPVFRDAEEIGCIFERFSGGRLPGDVVFISSAASMTAEWRYRCERAVVHE